MELSEEFYSSDPTFEYIQCISGIWHLKVVGILTKKPSTSFILKNKQTNKQKPECLIHRPAEELLRLYM